MKVADVNALEQGAFTAVFGRVFEHSSWVAEGAWARRPFRDAQHLHAELCATMRRAPTPQQLTLIRAHPVLAGKLARSAELTAESAEEQRGAGLTQLTLTQQQQLKELNDKYRDRFGFPFIICARFQTPEMIIKAMKVRVKNSPATEYEAALVEIEKIAWLRLQDLLKQP